MEPNGSGSSLVGEAGPRPRPIRHGIPPDTGRALIGRAELLHDIKQRLLRGEDIALYAGLPGAGKTALAHHIALDPDIASSFEDYIIWTSLGTTPDIGLRLQFWALALGIMQVEIDRLGDDLEQRITDQIGDQAVLLIIDDAWTSAHARHFKLGQARTSRLLTTRLDSVARDFSGTSGAVNVEVLDKADALKLFEQFAPTVIQRAPDRARKCLDQAGGLPLLIILIARHLEVAAAGAAEELNEALDEVLGSNWRLGETADASDYRESLKAAIQRSQSALSIPCQRALASLAVFPPRTNTFSIEAVDRIGQVERAAREMRRYGLVDLTTPDPERYTVHQAIADYARESLEDESAYQRMADFFIDYVERQKRSGADKAAWLESIEQERINLGAALEWSERSRDARTGLRLVSAMFDFWYERSHFAVGKEWIDRILALPGADSEELALERAKALNDSGNFAYSQADLADALERYEESRRLRTGRDEHAVAGSLNNIGLVNRERGNYEQADALFREAIEINQRTWESQGSTAALARNWLARNLNNLGRSAEQRGEAGEAQRLQEESLAIFTELDHDWGIAMARGDLGAALRMLEDLSAAKDQLERSLRLRLRIKDRHGVASSLRGLAAIAGDQGELERAEAQLKASIRLSMEIADREGIALCLQTLARVAADRDDGSRAATYLGAAEAFRTDNGSVDPPVIRDRLVAIRGQLAHRLGVEVFEAATSAGRGAELHAVANECLSGVVPTVEEVVGDILGPDAAE
jgi:tetratricopeptide (TPR) repeat protein